MSDIEHRFAEEVASFLADKSNGDASDFVRDVSEAILFELGAAEQAAIRSEPWAHVDALTAIIREKSQMAAFRSKMRAHFSGASVGRRRTRVFVSYRRRETEDLARDIVNRLNSRPGREIAAFFDREGLSTGSFPAALRRAVAECDCFLLMVTATTFDRAFEPTDWIRQEIELAIQTNKVVIPVLVDGPAFDGRQAFPEMSKLPESIHDLMSFNAVEFHRSLFDVCFDKLCSLILSSKK